MQIFIQNADFFALFLGNNLKQNKISVHILPVGRGEYPILQELTSNLIKSHYNILHPIQ